MSFALRADGAIEGWGASLAPLTPSGTGFTQVAAGYNFALALTANGSIEPWGLDTSGQVSDAPSGNGFIQITAGGFHALALRADGSIVGWGNNNNGQATPPAGTGYIQIAAGAAHSLALRGDGSIVSWGADDFGVVSNTPSETGFTQIDSGPQSSHSLALRADGSIAGWGWNFYGQASNFPAGPGFTQISAGTWHSIALAANGTISSWGRNYGGAVSDTPGGPGFTHVDATGFGSHALNGNNQGVGFCFGDGTGATCPCGGTSDPGKGCPNSCCSGGAELIALGNASISSDTFGFLGKRIPGGNAGLCIKGSTQLGGGIGNHVGEGLLCTSPQIRSQVVVSNGSGNVIMSDWRGQPFGTFPGAANVGAPTYYQWWYRDPSNTCSGQGFNFTNGWCVDWLP